MICDSTTGVIQNMVSLPTSGLARYPVYSCIDICLSTGYIYIGDSNNQQTLILDRHGQIIQRLNTAPTDYMRVRYDGSFFVKSNGDPLITHYSMSGVTLGGIRLTSSSDYTPMFIIRDHTTDGSILYPAVGNNDETIINEIDILSNQIIQTYHTTLPSLSTFCTLSLYHDNLYVYDDGNSRVIVFASDGTIINSFYTLISDSYHQLSSTIDCDGNLWLGGLSQDHPVISYDTHNQLRSWSYPYPSLYAPEFLTIQQNSSTIYIADTWNSRIITLNDNGGIDEVLYTKDLYCKPIGLAVNAQRDIYITCQNQDSTFYRIDGKTHMKSSIDITSSGSKYNIVASQVVVDINSYIYINEIKSSAPNSCVYKVDPKTYTIIQTYRMPATPKYPNHIVYGMTVDMNGDVYLKYDYSNIVYRFSSSGIARDITYTSSDMPTIYRLYVDITGMLYTGGSNTNGDGGDGLIISYDNDGIQQTRYLVDGQSRKQFIPDGIGIDHQHNKMYALDHNQRVYVWNMETIQQQQQPQLE